MQWIDDVKRCWRMISMQCMAAAVGLQTAWESVPDELKTGIPHQWVTYGTVALLVLGMLGRMVKQEPQDKP